MSTSQNALNAVNSASSSAIGDSQSSNSNGRLTFTGRVRRLPTSTKAVLLCYTIFTIIQLTIIIVTVSVSAAKVEESRRANTGGDATLYGRCEESPLSVYLVVQGLLILFFYPVILLLRVYKRRPSDAQAGSNSSGSTGNLPNSLDQGSSRPAVAQSVSNTRNATTAETTPGFLEPLKAIRSFLDLMSTMWFILGNYWIFSAVRCASTAPILFYTSLYFVCIVYLRILIPLVLLLLIIFCFPVVVGVVRLLARYGLLGDISAIGGRGLDDKVIAKINKIKYDPKAEQDGVAVIPKEDAQCSICLQEYEPGEDLRQLNCKHHFHSQCLDDWLRLEARCPLCNRKILEDGSANV
ncbi:hypothetical protein MP638_005271 [Amoeboaphelidium occidentale]|nr:hypothetical protein MP638_005271 [Amoeboaphelidium occidentale]